MPAPPVPPLGPCRRFRPHRRSRWRPISFHRRSRARRYRGRRSRMRLPSRACPGRFPRCRCLGARRDGATVARAADTAATRGQHGGVSRNRQPCAFFLRAVSLDIGRAPQRVAAIPAKADSGIAADRIGRQLYRTVDCNGAEHGVNTRFAAGGVASRLPIAAARDRVECGASGQRDIANAFGENEDTPPLARTANPVCRRSVRACSARDPVTSANDMAAVSVAKTWASPATPSPP